MRVNYLQIAIFVKFLQHIYISRIIQLGKQIELRVAQVK